MKIGSWLNIAIGVIFLLLSTGSCSEEPERNLGVPEWLQERIREDEQLIAQDPTRRENFGAWFRYEFGYSFLYEYRNPVSSFLIPNPYSYSGDLVNLQEDPYKRYSEKKCCETLIWKAPGYYEVD